MSDGQRGNNSNTGLGLFYGNSMLMSHAQSGSHIWTCHKISTKIADYFYFSILLHGGPIKTNKTASCTILSHLWPPIFPESCISWKKKKHNRFFVLKFLFFYFSILFTRVPIKVNKTARHTILSHLWTEIFPKIAYFGEKKKQ